MNVKGATKIFDLRLDEASNKSYGIPKFDRKSVEIINSIAYGSAVVKISEMARKCLKEEYEGGNSGSLA